MPTLLLNANVGVSDLYLGSGFRGRYVEHGTWTCLNLGVKRHLQLWKKHIYNIGREDFSYVLPTT